VGVGMDQVSVADSPLEVVAQVEADASAAGQRLDRTPAWLSDFVRCGWPAGEIVAGHGELVRVRPRRWLRRGSRLEVWIDGRWPRLPVDHCQLYFGRPRVARQYMVLSYGRCGQGTRLRTVHVALGVLEQIAGEQGLSGMLLEASTTRLSDSILARYGWQRHARSLRGRHYIKRLAQLSSVER
jgi:hypothetical protein